MIDRPVMLITGTSRGLGRSMAEYYGSNGFQVVGCSRTQPDASIQNYRHFSLNVTDEAKVKEMFQDICKEFGRLDVLINNAALHATNYALLTPLETVEAVFKVNVGAAFLFSCEAVKLMKQRRYGRIVNISSEAISLGGPGTSLYGASKAALEQFTRVFAREVSHYGVAVNALRLSFVDDTGMKSHLSERVVADTVEQTILKRTLKVQEVCGVMDLLISEKSQPLIGQTVFVGGI